MLSTRRKKEQFRAHRTLFTTKAKRLSERFSADVYILILRDGRWYSWRALNDADSELSTDNREYGVQPLPLCEPMSPLVPPIFIEDCILGDNIVDLFPKGLESGSNV